MKSLAFRLPPEVRGVQLALFAVTCAAVLVGIYARFKGLGTWPLGIDEYYTARTVQNVLRSGLPEFACGGYYARGLLVQYLGALLQLGGMSPELSLRLIAAISSLIVLPAAFILGRRAGGFATGLVTVTVLALSVWEVEMARFARMYAPFQAVFCWYVVFFLKYTLDREARALWPMIVLSVVGALVWEGGVFLAALNLLPPIVNHANGRFSRRDWRYLAGTALLVPPLYLLATNNLRMYSREYPFPPGWTGPATSHLFVSGLKAGTRAVDDTFRAPALAVAWRSCRCSSWRSRYAGYGDFAVAGSPHSVCLRPSVPQQPISSCSVARSFSYSCCCGSSAGENSSHAPPGHLAPLWP